MAFVPPIIGLGWTVKELLFLRSIKLTGHETQRSEKQIEGGHSLQKSLGMMQEISQHIAEGATAFLVQEYKYMLVYMVVFSVIIGPLESWMSTCAFVVGCLTSIACGYVGMKTAVYANVRTAHECMKDMSSGFNVAIRGGSVMGFTLVSLGVLTMYIMLLILERIYGNDTQRDIEGKCAKAGIFQALAGYGLGGSSIALFGRVGGGIYTKAADVGADLSGKNEYGMNEDDPRNPACIADNVGDNVGDIAGMGADLFGSFAEATCAAMVIASKNIEALKSDSLMIFPLLLTSAGIIVGILTMVGFPLAGKIADLKDIERALKYVLGISTLLQTGVVVGLAYWFVPEIPGFIGPGTASICVVVGLWSGLFVGLTTEYYTSHSYKPVREIAESQKVSAATGIIFGLAAGYLSTIIPVILLAITICVSHIIGNTYGISLAALGMLGTLTIALTIDAYGPISDNAGGIAEMSELGPEIRSRTDALDAAGNTTAAIGKGFAIGSAALVSLALFGAFSESVGLGAVVNIKDPWVFSGLLYGAMMPYAFSAMTMKSVGKAANDMVAECMRQFPKIMSGEMLPQYNRCIAISTNAAIREMIAPGALVILSPILGGVIFGKNFVAGLLTGSLISGVMLAISMSNTGGAWDNAKKYIEAGGLGPSNMKGSATHKNAVTGDTVGDPLKDTSGPSLNILIKLSAIISLVFADVIRYRSQTNGSPTWMN